MCYTGKCKHEGHTGDCTIVGGDYPDDAACIIADREIDRANIRRKIKEKQSRLRSDDMTDSCKKFICEKAGVIQKHLVEHVNEWDKLEISLEILIRAMLAINREWIKSQSNMGTRIMLTPDGVDFFVKGEFYSYNKKDHSNSEQSALQAALEYVYSHVKETGNS